MRKERDLLGDGIEIHIGIPFRQEDKCCRRQETPECSDLETIGMMYGQHIEHDVHASWAIPYSRRLQDTCETIMFGKNEIRTPWALTASAVTTAI